MGISKKTAFGAIALPTAGLIALFLIRLLSPEDLHRDIAFGCFAACAAGYFAISCLYFFTPKFMAYHRDASGVEWDDLSPQFQSLILAVLRIVAGGFFCAAFAVSVLLWIPFRQGLEWSGPVIFAVHSAMTLPAIYGTIIVETRTPATPPLIPLVFALVLSAMGLVLSI